tara:strand:+ start:10622 stop:10885 length:264 start_codon:yes stop_codon:yes gene_type:complete
MAATVVTIKDVAAFDAGKINGANVIPWGKEVGGQAAAAEATEFADGYILARYGFNIRERSHITHSVKVAHRAFFLGHLVGTGAVTVA